MQKQQQVVSPQENQIQLNINPQLSQEDGISNIPKDVLSLQDLRAEHEDQKEKRGSCLLLFVIGLYLAMLVANSIWIRDTVLYIWITILFVIFSFPILLSRFGVLSKLVEKFAPFLNEPNDYLKWRRENR